MGKRSRKRLADVEPAAHAAGHATRAERDAARRTGASAPRRPARTKSRAENRPAAPWGRFPLVELLVLIALILLVLGFIERRGAIIAAGLGIGSVAGLELSIREHFAGFRSHTTLLAAAVAFVAIVATSFATSGSTRVIALPVAGAVFIVAFWLLRRTFARRSGGVGFRR